MPLNVHKTKDEVMDDGIDLIEDNDAFFTAYTSLRKCPLEDKILMTIDKAAYLSEQQFIGRTKKLVGLNKNQLSTGTKTLLNIIRHPELCFSVVECGDNALEFMLEIHEGHILCGSSMLWYAGNPQCDIVYKGKHYSDIYDFLDAIGGRRWL